MNIYYSNLEKDYLSRRTALFNLGKCLWLFPKTLQEINYFWMHTLFHFDIIVDLLALVRNHGERPLYSFSSFCAQIPSCKARVKSPKPDTDVGAKIQNISITTGILHFNRRNKLQILLLPKPRGKMLWIFLCFHWWLSSSYFQYYLLYYKNM